MKRRLLFALLTPVGLLLLVGGLLERQLFSIAHNARWVEHTDIVIAKVYEVQKRIFEPKTSVRGYHS